MYERSWEGEVEIRVPGKDSLRVVARLWRHDDASGSDWGGQLEIDVATATRLGTGEYAIVLPDGRESTVRLSRGASRARSAYPTFSGRGAPPFGSDIPKEQLLAAEDEAADVEEADEVVSAPVEEAIEVARPARRRSRAAAPEPVAEAPPAADGEPDELDVLAESPVPEESAVTSVADEVPAAEPPVVPAETPDEQPGAPDPPTPQESVRARTTVGPVQTPETSKMADSPRTVVRTPAGAVSPTEVMARAYLQAVETRRNLDGSSAEGFEARILGGVAGIVDELAGLFEQRLRGERPDRQRGSDWLQQRFIVLDWFRAVVEDYEPMAATSADLQGLIDTAIALFEGDTAQAAA